MDKEVFSGEQSVYDWFHGIGDFCKIHPIVPLGIILFIVILVVGALIVADDNPSGIY